MQVGDLTGEGGRFRRWNLDSDVTLKEIARRWNEYGGAIGRSGGDFVCWLSNTENGDRVARATLE